jgi:hypothetical protein
LSPWQWYTFDFVFTHTWPGPPPGAAAVCIADPEDFAAGCGGGAAGATAGLAGAAVVVGAFEGAAAGALFEAVLSYQSFTPPWPEHAPRFEGALVYVPSLHSPVEPAGACALLVAATIMPVANAADASSSFMLTSSGCGSVVQNSFAVKKLHYGRSGVEAPLSGKYVMYGRRNSSGRNSSLPPSLG